MRQKSECGLNYQGDYVSCECAKNGRPSDDSYRK